MRAQRSPWWATAAPPTGGLVRPATRAAPIWTRKQAGSGSPTFVRAARPGPRCSANRSGRASRTTPASLRISTPPGPWVAGARDWGADNRVADIGGGTGGTLRSILARHPHLSGTLIDLPETVARARDNSPAQEEPTGTTDTAARMTFCPQSFFAPLPPGHDVLLLAHIFHDWADDDCVRLLRGGAPPQGKRGTNQRGKKL
ncbi:methyltransferase, partial [Streptomyces sp. NPDC055107]